MAEESKNVRRCGQIGDGDDDELSMVDVLNEQARLQADANAVLGGSDEKNCTYPQGYLKRQALYACATCTPAGNAGICLACSYACHEGHDLYELYTKRFFTCDCGNEKFGGKDCKLYKVEDEMIQCIMCEDWYHGRHLKASVPESDDFQEMTCPGCMSKYSFLWAYCVPGQVVSVKREETNGETEVLDVSTNGEREESASGAGEDRPVTKESNGCVDPKVVEAPAEDEQSQLTGVSTDTGESSSVSQKRGSSGAEAEAPSPKKLKGEEERPETASANNEDAKKEEKKDQNHEECVLKSLQKRVVDHPDCAAFWPEGWRDKLCRCPDCMEMYKDREIEFLIDESDTVHAYEAKGRDAESNLSDEETEASVLAGMNRVQQIEMIRGVMDLKTELNEFLHGFAREGKVVRETDIREFFERMDQRRRERVHIPQQNCR